MVSLRRALGYLRHYWLTTLMAFVSLLLTTAGSLVMPQIIRLIIDSGITARNAQVIVLGAFGVVVVALVRALFSFLQGYLSEKASQGVAYDLRNVLYSKIESLSFSYHDQAQTGQLMTRVTSDVEAVREFAGQGVLQLVSALLMLLGSAAILVRMNWNLAMIALLTIPVMLVAIGQFVRKVSPMFGRVQAKLGALNTVLQENLVGVRVVQAFAREPYEAGRYRRVNQELLDQNLAVVRMFSGNFPIVFFVYNLGVLGVVWLGGLWVIGGELSIGQLVAFLTYLNFLIMPVFMLGMQGANISRADASAKRIFEIIDAESEVTDRPGAMPLPPVEGRVAFEDVSFRYVGADRDTLSHVSFIAEPGQTVAILGATGSGKSSIINLIPRFYDVTGGRVAIDGIDVRNVTLESLRTQVGIVLQETTLFSGSIRENIAFGRPEATMEEIAAAARAAQAHDFIAALPQGYDTPVGERGTTLSGGQKQRIAIARALLVNPRILILDDSTSSVDAETEYQIQQALAGLMRGRTSFVIAQRISTVRNADLILVLDQGKVAASGTHETLMAESALYAEIVGSQLREDETEFRVSSFEFRVSGVELETRNPKPETQQEMV